ncbi:hypothetical protein ISN45_Aa05g002530 [Arabidopsis thaliana x Arabidopsis arenosa]|uniref:Uncharacterized protein n=1 Tax=Arabidopsis thaliana x Arabidopsis arenosa TaxID=1240361 RepID=A0A8T1ZK85_9BRAS|nr:hypothetical protein ISN45_Aa05g002530 [Arabidopsis thaliana x Arabidopsis arenosa]
MMQTKISSFSRPSFSLHEPRVVHHPRISMAICSSSSSSSSSSSPFHHLLCKSAFPLAASLTLLLSPCTAEAGLMSGSPGIESVPGPELPKIEFLDRFNAKNQKFYAENDARFKESPLLKKLLENSKLNKDKNEREIQDKYCLRGAEWGVGDCSTTGMTDEEKEKFITMLKKKTGVE